jgi:phosphoglycolate phosphatase
MYNINSERKFDSIIFDLDGTLWDAVDNILISWNEVLKKHPEAKRILTVEELTACMGLKMDEIADKLFPYLTKAERLNILNECSDFELEYLAKNGAKLFDNIKDVIVELSSRYKLFICSNCQAGYIECFLKYFNLEQYFTDTECWGNTYLTKGENNRLLIERNHLTAPIYVGDTQGDLASSRFANIPFVFASYGFGSVDDYNYIISSPSDLLKIL